MNDILGEELQMRFQVVICCLICLLGLRQIHFTIWRNIFDNLDKYSLQFDEIHFTILTNMSEILGEELEMRFQAAFAGSALLAWPETNTFKIFGEIYLTI